LAGPSALVTVLLFSSQAKMAMGYYLLVLSLVAMCWLVILLIADRLQRVLGARVITAFERLMGLLLTAMAIEMLLAGLSIYLATLPVLLN
jgi:small neutral amino acid transporter SnatA (MarC family)